MLSRLAYIWCQNTCQQKISSNVFSTLLTRPELDWAYVDALGCRIATRQIPVRTLHELKSVVPSPQRIINTLLILWNEGVSYTYLSQVTIYHIKENVFPQQVT